MAVQRTCDSFILTEGHILPFPASGASPRVPIESRFQCVPLSLANRSVMFGGWASLADGRADAGFCQGVLVEVKPYGRALSAGEIWQHYQAARAPMITRCADTRAEKNQLPPGEGVYVKASGLQGNADYPVWIQHHPPAERETPDAAGDPSGGQENVTTASDGSLLPRCIWQIPSNAPVAYDE